MKNKYILLLLDESVKSALAQIARQQSVERNKNVSVSQLIREAITEKYPETTKASAHLLPYQKEWLKQPVKVCDDGETV